MKAKRRKRTRAGVCRRCGCKESRACPGGCHWVDASRTLCSRCQRFEELGLKHKSGVELYFTEEEAWAVLYQLQLIVGHPANTGPMAKLARSAATQLEQKLGTSLQARAFIAAGWEPPDFFFDED